MKKTVPVLILTFFLSFAFGQKAILIDSAGIKLRQFYLGENVENLWIAGQHVNWETGEPDNPKATKGIKTHCSSFVASVCKQKGIYVLRPPEHKTGLLANAQYDWLFTNDAYNKGWRQIKDSIFENAQNFANQGYIVAATYKNLNPQRPGHIALVMPFEKQIDDLYKEGPTVIQAGEINKNFISLKNAFKRHISNWTKVTEEVVFFYNKNKIQ